MIFKDRRRPVKFKYSENPLENYQSLICAVEKVFYDVLTAEEGSSSSETGGFYLQTESNEWGGKIDVTAETPVEDRSILFLCRPTKSRRYSNADSDSGLPYDKSDEQVR